MKQDIIPYHDLRQNRIRSEQRTFYQRPVAVVSLNEPVGTPVRVVEIDTYVFEPAPMTRPIESLSAEEKVQVLEQALIRARRGLKAERRRGLRRRILT